MLQPAATARSLKLAQDAKDAKKTLNSFWLNPFEKVFCLPWRSWRLGGAKVFTGFTDSQSSP
jgi:hypothetical protein